MAIVTTDDKHYRAIAAAIRKNSHGAVDTEIKPEEMAMGIGNVAFHNYYQGENSGVLIGKEAEYDAFWDVFQNYGDAYGANYYYAFAYDRFTDENFNPKYDIICSSAVASARSIFYGSNTITDTKKPIRVLGNNMLATFYNSKALVTIRKLIVNTNITYSTTFDGCSSLQNIEFEGTIGKDISFKDSAKLTKASITDIINALSNTTSGMTLTLSGIALTNAFGDITSEEWRTLRETKPNWTISML